MEPMNVALFGKRGFADGIKLRISKQNYSGLAEWTLNPLPSVLIKDREGKTQA